MAKRPPKSTIEQNILLFLQHHESATLDTISTYVDLQNTLTEQVLSGMISRGFVSKESNKYYPNYLYPEL